MFWHLCWYLTWSIISRFRKGALLDGLEFWWAIMPCFHDVSFPDGSSWDISQAGGLRLPTFNVSWSQHLKMPSPSWFSLSWHWDTMWCLETRLALLASELASGIWISREVDDDNKLGSQFRLCVSIRLCHMLKSSAQTFHNIVLPQYCLGQQISAVNQMWEVY